MGGWGILRNGGGDPSNGRDHFEMGGLIPLYGLCCHHTHKNKDFLNKEERVKGSLIFYVYAIIQAS